MSRRDTILIAVITNVVILTLLFVSALKPNREVEVASAPKVEKEVLAKSQKSVDQVDQVLDTFAEEKKEEFVSVLPKAELLPDKKWIEVEVQSGDVLEKIARRNHTTVEEIVRANHLSSTKLKVGQTLYISPGEKKKENVTKEQATKTYIVKAGDSPWTIAIKNHMKVDELLTLNGLNEAKAKKLKPGDTLIIR